MKILLAVDGSHVTKLMLSHIAAHDELLGAGHTYCIATIVTPVTPYAASFVDHATLGEYYAEEADKVFASIRPFAAQQKWQATFRHAAGHAAETIAAWAENEHFDLIVMGTHGHSSLVNVALGSVVTGVLARCKTPLLLIR